MNYPAVNGGAFVQKKMSAGKRRTIYGIATQLGIYEKDNKDDDLHAIVYRVTNKESIGLLTDQEADLVIGELVKLKGISRARMDRKKPSGKKAQEHRPGMISPGQEKTIWFYMYRLEELDVKPSQLSRAERLCAIIKKYLHIDAASSNPFQFMSFKAGSTLIEILKNMVRYETETSGRGRG